MLHVQSLTGRLSFIQAQSRVEDNVQAPVDQTTITPENRAPGSQLEQCHLTFASNAVISLHKKEVNEQKVMPYSMLAHMCHAHIWSIKYM
jgi:hypothetical protein